MLTWFGDEDLPNSSLIKSICNFVAKKEKITANVVYIDNSAVKGPFTYDAQGNEKKPTIWIPHNGSMNEVFQAKQKLSTLARMRASIIKNIDLPKEMKLFLILLSDILHEMGHVNVHYDSRGRSRIDMHLYIEDLEYRLQKENEAEELVTKWFKHFGFYAFINDATKLD